MKIERRRIGLIVILITGYALVLFNAGLAGADEIAELKAQIKALQETIDNLSLKVESLEKKQEVQSEKVEKVPGLVKTVDELKEARPLGALEGARVGGHFKLFMFDQSRGERNDVNQNNQISAGVSTFYLYIDRELSDTVSMSLQPKIAVSASATPSLGSDISRVTTGGTVSTSFHQAFMKALLPKGIELKAGLMNTLFSEEYGREIWWDEQYHQNRKLDSLQSLRDTGIELYKNFDFENWSLPAYFYLLNGKNYVDDNEGKSILVHFAPELPRNIRLLGSLGGGKWDSNNKYYVWRYAAGFEGKYRNFSLMSEYLYHNFENKSLTGGGLTDTEEKGYYIKGLYRFTPQWRGLVKYSDVDLPYTGGSSLLADNYKATTLGLNYFITESSIIMGELTFVNADRSDGSETLKYYRPTISWRTTF